MKNKKVVVLGRLKPCFFDVLEKKGIQVQQWDSSTVIPGDRLRRWLAGADGLVLGRGSGGHKKMAVNKALLDLGPSLKVIAQDLAGYDNVTVGDCTAAGIPFGSAAGANAESVAEEAMGLVYMTARRMIEAWNFVRDGQWAAYAIPPEGVNLMGKTAGIVGIGAIGQAFARRAEASGMRIIYHARSLHPDAEGHGWHWRDMDRLLAESDVIVSATPLTSATHQMWNLTCFEKMKKTAFFLNVGRGGCVKTEDLAEALRTGKLAGAALDVVDPEPIPPDHPLLQTGKCIVLPHMGSMTEETLSAMSMETAENVVEGLKGRPLPRIVNPEVYGTKQYQNKWAGEGKND